MTLSIFSVTRLGYFLKVLKAIFRTKVAQISQLFGLFGTSHFLVKTAVATFWTSIQTIGQLFFLHLVTLAKLVLLANPLIFLSHTY